MTIPLWRHCNIWQRHLRENFTSRNVISNFRLNEGIVSTADFIFCRMGIRKLSKTWVRTKFVSTWYVAIYYFKISVEILRKPDNLTFIQGDQFPGWSLKLRPKRDVGPLTTISRLRHKCVYSHICNLRSGPHIAFGSLTRTGTSAHIPFCLPLPLCTLLDVVMVWNGRGIFSAGLLSLHTWSPSALWGVLCVAIWTWKPNLLFDVCARGKKGA